MRPKTDRELRAEVRRLKAELAERQASFEHGWKSDMRAIREWQKAHPGNDLTWPSNDRLCLWLMAQLAAERRKNSRLIRILEKARLRRVASFIGKVTAAPSQPGTSVTHEEPHIERFRRLIERQYAHSRLGSGSVGGCFGSILCHELHNGGDGSGLHFAALADKWGVSLAMLGDLIADHCRRLEPDPVVKSSQGPEGR